MIPERDANWSRALVMFSGRTDLWWLRLLRRGYRHCFVALEGEGGWVVIDPLAHRTVVLALPPCAALDLAAFYRQHGLEVVETAVAAPPRRPAPWRPHTCVESVKRILGISAPFILTPRQLSSFIRERGKKSLTPPDH
ncbi:MAG: hypothetical protein HY985_10955 [Magnetospirillum sp.]|nr:hypothetical protein [Magnetospirillum sp.]